MVSILISDSRNRKTQLDNNNDNINTSKYAIQ